MTEYTIISGKKDHFQSNFQKIFTYKHPKASKFENCDTEQGLVAELEKEEDRLNIEYQQLIGIFEEIQQNMS